MKSSKVLAFVLAVVFVITNFSLPVFAASEDNINEGYLGVYHDTQNSEAFINLGKSTVFDGEVVATFFAFCYSYAFDKYVRGTVTDFSMGPTKFTAYASSIRRCTADGVALSTYEQEFTVNAKVPLGTPYITIEYENHKYAKD
ncbi:MAG: hypothetical protein K2O14_14660 [Oscillospiraceae bacterium]|nr:hypothetical protein [Oscillospiraceae bacterium]